MTYQPFMERKEKEKDVEDTKAKVEGKVSENETLETDEEEDTFSDPDGKNFPLSQRAKAEKEKETESGEEDILDLKVWAKWP